ncbi:MAG: hypothetical protein SGILL_006041 [Bacillariaceae sp.]
MNLLSLSFWLALSFSLVHSEDIVISPWQLRAPNDDFMDMDANVGDTITFIWNATTENHTVYINPTRNCDDTDAIFLGDTSPTSYTFTAADASLDGFPHLFVDNLEGLCEAGMRFIVTVFRGSSAPVSPTDPPITPSAPTDAPVAPSAPVAPVAPVAPTAPTDAPVAPSDAPVAPTAPPTTAPPTTLSPSSGPPTTIAPSSGPPTTLAPSSGPPTTIVPSTVPPTTAPPTTIAPTTLPPTDPPTEAPILIIPTDPPVFPSAAPSAAPVVTSEPSAEVQPTVKPTVAPTPAGSIEQTLVGLRMGLAGTTEFPASTQRQWESLSAEFSESFIINDAGDSVQNFATTFEVTSVMPVDQRRKMIRGQRELQQSAVILEYTQTMRYDTTDSSITPELMATTPFEGDAEKQSYVTLLKTSDDPVLQDIAGVSSVLVPNTQPPATAPTPAPGGKDPVLSTAAIIGIACGGGALLIAIVLYFLYCRKGRGGGADKDINSSESPPLHVNVREDEVSTLAGPTGPPTYAYGGAGDTSVSSAGGTFGSNTQNQSALDPANAAATGAALGSMPTDDSFDPGFRDPNNVKEEIIQIFAPPGKLGVVIDTPDDGAPVVHAVKDSSVIADKITVGDKLVAVDDEDVRSMTAIKVSKLISRKSANPSRKLTVIRTTILE